MNKPGTTVYVHWYGKLLQGTVVNDHDLMGMVAVRIPLQGGHPVALFTPAHVYASETAANGILADEPHKKLAEDRTATTCKDSKPSSEAWLSIQKFKEKHWDTAHNHLRIDALNDFYRLWRIAVAAKYDITIEDSSVLSGFPDESPIITVDPGSPDGDKSGTIIVDTETGEILPELPAEVEHRPIAISIKQKMAVKLTRQQLRSTSRIQYTDSIQTSIFD